jgi:hypothetical protein
MIFVEDKYSDLGALEDPLLMYDAQATPQQEMRLFHGDILSFLNFGDAN